MFGQPKLKFEAAGYSVEIQVLFRENRRIVYREQGHAVDIGAEAVGPKWNQLNAILPAGTGSSDAERIAKNVANALSHLGYEYAIFERGEDQVVPERERIEAEDRLRDLGFKASTVPGGRVQLTRAGIPLTSQKKFTPSDAMDVMRTVSAVRGVRPTHKLLAKSGGAL